MDDPYAVDRRDFLKAGAVAAASSTVGCGGADPPWRALTDAEASTLAAACDRIVPPDGFPGAVEAGAVVFIDRQLATRAKDEHHYWQDGVAALDATSRRKHGASLAEVGPEERDALLREVEAGRVDEADWKGLEPRAFFDRLVSWTMMGYYGDPRHGGNRERVSWRMLGVPDPPVRGRLHETPPPPPPARS